MVLTRENFSSLDDLKGQIFFLGDDSVTNSLGKGRFDLDHGSFNDVLYVPGIVANLLSVYHMTHTRSPKKVVFSPNDVEISEILNGRVIERGVVDHSSNLYKFFHFLPFSNLL